MIRYDIHVTIRYETIRHDTTQCDMIQYDTTQHKTTRHDNIYYSTIKEMSSTKVVGRTPYLLRKSHILYVNNKHKKIASWDRSKFPSGLVHPYRQGHLTLFHNAIKSNETLYTKDV